MAQVQIDNLAYPYYTVVYVEATFSDHAVFTGSGVMVGPNDVLTASHVVYDGAHGGAATSVKIIPGYDPSPLETPYGTLTSSFINYNPGIDPNNDGFIVSGDNGPGLAGSELDFAVVGLNTAIGDLTGWMGIDPKFSSGIVNITGYPGFYGKNPMNDSGSISQDGVDYIFHYGSIEVRSGNSGGPAWYSLNGSPQVVSVVSTSSWGPRLSGSNFDVIANWISSNDSLIANADRQITGTAGADYITTDGGNDTINALGGDDGVIAGAGNDLVNGGDGNDTIYGQGGTDTLNGEAGNDYLDGGDGNDSLAGGAGDDAYVVGGSGDTVTDSAGIDTVRSYIPWILAAGLENLTLLGSAAYGVGNSADNTIMGNAASNPLLRGEGGNDHIYGGAGDDWIEGDNSTNVAITGNDDIQGDDGNDTILGGPGDDTVHGNAGNDTIVGEAGNDVLYGDEGVDALDGRGGSDQLFGGEQIDYMFGDGYPSTYGAGSDTLYGGGDNDLIMGESGEPGMLGALDILYGEDGNDQLDGGGGNDWIFGGNGVDIIDGDHGSDFIVGGPGGDIMLGSGASIYSTATTGGDLFGYTSLADGGDQIYGFDLNFASGNDGIDLRPLFDALGYAGTNPRADGFLYVLPSGADTNVYVDPTGNLDGPQLTQLAMFASIIATSLTDSYFLFQ